MTLITSEDSIAVFGSGGMAGSAICRSLSKKGYFLQMKPLRKDLDLLDQTSVDLWFKTHKPQIVVLAAAKVGGIYANNSFCADFLLENLKIQTNVISSAWTYGVKRLLFLGSSCIYPKHASQPMVEESLLSSGLEPTNEWYAIAKIAGIKLCQSLRMQYGFDAISLMPTNLYGPGDNYHPKNSHVLPALIRRFFEAKLDNLPNVTCWGSGMPRREFLHADDLGSACTFALEEWNPDKRESPRHFDGSPLTYLNVGTGTDLSIKELAHKIASIMDYSGEIYWDSSYPDGAPSKCLEVSRLSQMGWNASTPLDDGLKSTVSIFRQLYGKNTLRM